MIKNTSLKKLWLFPLTIFLSAVIVIFLPKAPVEAAKYSVKIDVTSKDYGAKSGQDSTKAIQKALDEAAKKGTKKKPALVSIPKGTYYISKPLVIGSNTTLSLSKNTVMKKTGNPIPLYMLMSKVGTKGGYKETENITVTGGKWDEEYKKYNDKWGGTQFFFVHTTNLKIKNIEFCNNFATHFIELGGVNKVTISGCTFHGFKYASDNKIKECIQLDVNHNSDMMSGAGVYDDSSCNNVTIKDNEFYDYPRAIGSHVAVDGVYHQNITISDNYFHDIEFEPIYGYNYVNCTISSNRMEKIGGGITIRNNDTGNAGSYISRLPGIPATKLPDNNYEISISSNIISLNKANTDKSGSFTKAKGVYISGGEDKNIKNVVISDNTITADTDGIHLRYIKDAVIKYNTINRNKSAYDVLSSSYTEEGIMLENSEAVINETNISTDGSCYINGIGVHESSVEIKNTVINTVEKKGISVNGGGSAKISGSTIKNCKADYGLFVAGDSKVSISGSKITNCGKSGIYCEASTLSCSDTEVSNNEKSGFTLLDSHVELSGNTIKGNPQRSITITKSCSGYIKNNTFCSPDVSNEVLLSGSDSFSPSFSQVAKKTIQSYGGSYTDSCGNLFRIP